MAPEPSQDWQSVPLGTLARVHHGFAFKGEFFVDEPPGDILVTPGNFAIGGGFSWTKPKYYRGPVDSRYVLSPGELIITMTDLSKASDTLGSPALVPAAPDGGRLLHNQRLGRVEITAPERVARDFLYWALRAERYRQQVLASATGTTVKHTSPAKLCESVLPLPPVADQRRIASVLGSFEAQIASNRRLIGLLEETATALFRERFVTFIRGQELERTELGPVPRGWRVARIGDVLQVVGGSTPSTKEPGFWDGQHAWATPKDLAGLSSAVLLDTARHITDEGVARISSRLLPARTVLLSSRAPVGYTAISFTEVAVNQGFIAIPPTDGIPSEFVLLWLREHMVEIKAHASGTTFAEISKRNFRPLMMVVPSQHALDAFGELASPMFDQIAALERECRTLSAIQAELLPKLVSGQIRVPDGPDPAELVTPRVETRSVGAR